MVGLLLAAPAPGLDGAGRRTGPGRLGNGSARSARSSSCPALCVRADHRPGMAAQADQGRRADAPPLPCPSMVISFRNYVTIKHFSLAPVRRAGPSTAGQRPPPTVPRSRFPPTMRALCPSPSQQRRGPDWLDHGATSPDQVRDPPRRDAPRADGSQLQPARVRAAALAGGQRDQQGRGQALLPCSG